MKRTLILVGIIGLMFISSSLCEDDLDIEDEAYEEEEPELVVPQVERPEYKPPKAQGNSYFSEGFVSESLFKKRWVISSAKKDDVDEDIAKYEGKWKLEEPIDNPLQKDLGLVLKSKAKHHAIAAKLDKPFKFDGKPLIVQYEVKFQNGQECGGAYIKLLTQDVKMDLGKFFDKTPFTIMFGPDRCGNDEKLHFIFRHKNPVTGDFEEKHAKKPSNTIATYFSDKKTHLYKLVVNPDNTYEVSVDHDSVMSGSLLTDMDPPVNPPKEIVDPDDKKPEDWDEREKIPDPEATKPEDWDENAPEYIVDADAVKPEGWLDNEPELIPDPDSEKPSDWDEDMDGEWEPGQINNPACESAPGCGDWNPPEVKNPAYKGKWKAPKIDNPNYQGKWKPRMIENPEYFQDNDPYMMSTITAIGLELWSMSDDILFDNFLITDDESVAKQWAADTFDLKKQQELARTSGKSVVDAVMEMTNERPWLWAVILLVVVLPIVLLVAYCCSSSSSSQTKLEAAQRKKTDEATADDEEGEEDDVKEEPNEEEAKDEDAESSEDHLASGDISKKTKKSPRKAAKKATSKGDLNAEDQYLRDALDIPPSLLQDKKAMTAIKKSLSLMEDSSLSDLSDVVSFDTTASSCQSCQPDELDEEEITGSQRTEADEEDNEEAEEEAPQTRTSPRKRKTRKD